MSSKNDSGLMSSAGLVRYFDAEGSKAVFVNPKTVAALALLFGVAILLLNVFIQVA